MKIKHKKFITKENDRNIISPDNVFEIFKKILDCEDELDRDKEHFWVIGLNRRNNIKYIELVHLGSVDRCVVGIKDVLRTAIYYCCSSIIICHNHPAGSIEPSKEDIVLTKAMSDACKTLDIILLDSIIIGDGHYSFKGNNLLG